MRKMIMLAIAMLMLTINAHAMDTPYIDGRTGELVIAEIHSQEDAIDIQEAPSINNISKALNALDALDEVDANGHHLEYLGEFTTTYYDSCRKCNGKWGAIDGFGNPLEWGCVAVDPKVIPMHTKLVVDGYDMIFEARDTGNGVNGKHIDIYVPVSHEEALRMGQGEKLKVWKYVE